MGFGGGRRGGGTSSGRLRRQGRGGSVGKREVGGKNPARPVRARRPGAGAGRRGQRRTTTEDGARVAVASELYRSSSPSVSRGGGALARAHVRRARVEHEDRGRAAAHKDSGRAAKGRSSARRPKQCETRRPMLRLTLNCEQRRDARAADTSSDASSMLPRALKCQPKPAPPRPIFKTSVEQHREARDFLPNLVSPECRRLISATSARRSSSPAARRPREMLDGSDAGRAYEEPRERSARPAAYQAETLEPRARSSPYARHASSIV